MQNDHEQCSSHTQCSNETVQLSCKAYHYPMPFRTCHRFCSVSHLLQNEYFFLQLDKSCINYLQGILKRKCVTETTFFTFVHTYRCLYHKLLLSYKTKFFTSSVTFPSKVRHFKLLDQEQNFMWFFFILEVHTYRCFHHRCHVFAIFNLM